MKWLCVYSDAETEVYVDCYLLLLTTSDSDNMSGTFTHSKGAQPSL
jgi:hypothetical protein